MKAQSATPYRAEKKKEKISKAEKTYNAVQKWKRAAANAKKEAAA